MAKQCSRCKKQYENMKRRFYITKDKRKDGTTRKKVQQPCMTCKAEQYQKGKTAEVKL